VIRRSETAVVGLSMRRSRWGTRGVYVGKLVAIRWPSQIRARRSGKPTKRYTASSTHGSDRALTCSSDGRRCTRRRARSLTCKVNASDAHPAFRPMALSDELQEPLCRTAGPQKLGRCRVTCGYRLDDACSSGGPMSVKILHLKMRQTLSAVGSGDDGDAYDPIQVCAVLNTCRCTLAPTIPPTL
jgi:hypothetical protein